jgi:hypothetical protein
MTPPTPKKPRARTQQVGALTVTDEETRRYLIDALRQRVESRSLELIEVTKDDNVNSAGRRGALIQASRALVNAADAWMKATEMSLEDDQS